MQKKVLFITRNFPPTTGGMEKLCFEVYKSLSDEYLVHLVCPKGAGHLIRDKDTYTALSNSLPLFFLGAFGYLFKSIFYRYHFVLGGSGLVSPLMLLNKVLSRKVLLFVHGLDLVASNPVYRLLFLPPIRFFDLVVSNSENTTNLALDLNIDKGKIVKILPGVDKFNLLSRSRKSQNHDFRNRHNLGSKKIILSVGRLVERKGIRPFIEHSFVRVLEEVPNAHFVLIGGEPDSAIKKDKGVLCDIENTIQAKEICQHVSILGRLGNDEVTQAFFESDAFVFPLIPVKGDVEGFGIVAIEAASFGLPTIAFNEGGVSDAVLDTVSGFLIDTGDYDSFSKRLISILGSDFKDRNKLQSINFAKSYSWERYGQMLLSQLSTKS